MVTNGYLENDNLIDNCPGGEWVVGEWFTSAPNTPGSYDFNVTWSFIHDNRHVHTSDNFTIYVRYPSNPGTVDDGSLALTVLALIVALGTIAVVSWSRSMKDNNST